MTAKKKDDKVKELQQRIEELEDQLKRSVADYRNLEKRFEEEKREVVRFANKELLLTLLPAFETLFLAERYVSDEGLRLTIKRVIDVLGQAGVERIKTEGNEFDPQLMECVETVDGEENKVVQETRPGFTLQGKLLVPAQVRVGKQKEKIQN